MIFCANLIFVFVCSIGSLGKELQEAGVQNVTVSKVTFTNTDNGVRIKTWAKPSNAFVRGVLYQNATMVNVKNPIIIDQNYCPDHKNCPNQVRSQGYFRKLVFFSSTWVYNSTFVSILAGFRCEDK